MIDPPYGFRPKSTNPQYECIADYYPRGYNASKYSILATCPASTIDDAEFTQLHRLSWYCEQRAITRKVAIGFIKKKWLACQKLKKILWVAERCPEEIQEYLEIKAQRKWLRG